ncbi:uncharacterized protein DC041_0000478, partial [Schistosoma bovis]
VFHLVHLECPYPPAQTTEDIVEANFVKISNPPPMNTTIDRIVVVVTQPNSTNDSSNHMNESHSIINSNDSSIINTITSSEHLLLNSSGNIRPISNIPNTSNDQLNDETISLNNNNDRSLHSTNMTIIHTDYDLLPDLSHHHFILHK